MGARGGSVKAGGAVVLEGTCQADGRQVLLSASNGCHCHCGSRVVACLCFSGEAGYLVFRQNLLILNMLATNSDILGQTKHVCRLHQARGHQCTVTRLELLSGSQEVQSVLVCKVVGKQVSV